MNMKDAAWKIVTLLQFSTINNIFFMFLEQTTTVSEKEYGNYLFSWGLFITFFNFFLDCSVGEDNDCFDDNYTCKSCCETDLSLDNSDCWVDGKFKNAIFYPAS